MLLEQSASSRSASLLGSLLLGLGISVFVVAPGCSSDDTATTTDGGAGSASTGTSGAAGSGTDTEGGACATPVASTAPDERCVDDGGPINQPATTCPSSAGDASTNDDGGVEAYPDPHDGTSAADDDCKYDVSYTLDCPGGSTTFTVTLKSRTTGMLLAGANPEIEADLNGLPLANPLPVTTTVSDGVYKISGVHFAMPGVWTVRFHFFETCLDNEETSKHAHVAFHVTAP